MSHALEDYKRLILQELLKRINKSCAYIAMENYKEDFLEFLDKNQALLLQ